MAGAYRLLVLEDDTFTRTTLRATLELLGHDVQAVATVREAIMVVANQAIDVALIDLDLGPGPNGADFIRILDERSPQIALILLTSFVDPRLLAARGTPLPVRCIYLLKQSIEHPDELQSAIEQSLAHNPAQLEVPKIAELTETQIETMRLVAEGLSNAEIAKQRFVSEKAVEQTISKIAKVLNLPAGNATNQRVQITRNYFRLIGRSS